MLTAALARPLPRTAGAAVMLMALPFLTLPAQPIPGAGPDAMVLPRGVFRVTVEGQLDSWASRFSSDESGAPTSDKVPLGSEFAGTALGTVRIGALAPLESGLRSLTGMSDFSLSLGDVRVNADSRRSTIPIRFELGLARRFQVTAMVPYVQTQTVMAASPNSGPDSWNVGSNPALTDAASASRNAAVIAQLRAAAAAVDVALAACDDGASSPVCADPSTAHGLNDTALAFASNLESIYGGTGTTGAPVVPRSGGAAATVIAKRLELLRASYIDLGVDAIEEGAAPAGAGVPVTATSFAATLDGLGIPTVRGGTRYGIGDIELGGRVMLVDGIGGGMPDTGARAGIRVRAALDALVRLGTGSPALVDRLLDVGTGDGQTDVEFGGVADVLFGRRFWASASLRYGVQLASDRELRLPSVAGESYVSMDRATVARVTPGNYMELQFVPRYNLGSFVSLAALYSYRHKGADGMEVQTAPDAAPIAVGYAARASETSEHHLGLGLTLSTLSAFAAGRIGMPLDVTYLHSRTVAGAGWTAAALARDQVTVRLYTGLFGNRR